MLSMHEGLFYDCLLAAQKTGEIAKSKDCKILASYLSCLFIINPALAEEQNHIWKAADGVYRYGPGDGYFSMFVVTDDGVIAIEPANIGHSKHGKTTKI